MKRSLCLLFSLLIILTITSCGTESDEVSDSEAPDADASAVGESLIDKFVDLGFTEEEATEMEAIFTTVGIGEIGEITTALGTGIDELQAFIAPIYDSNQLQVNFTVENRDLCYVAVAGVPGYEPELYISFFGNLKVREKRTIHTIDLFDRWVDDTDYHQPIEDSYLAKLDYENQEIVELEENSIQ